MAAGENRALVQLTLMEDNPDPSPCPLCVPIVTSTFFSLSCPRAPACLPLVGGCLLRAPPAPRLPSLFPSSQPSTSCLISCRNPVLSSLPLLPSCSESLALSPPLLSLEGPSCAQWGVSARLYLGHRLLHLMTSLCQARPSSPLSGVFPHPLHTFQPLPFSLRRPPGICWDSPSQGRAAGVFA